jgi:hypothetical protein
MSDPLSMANLSATALTEGIKFLYEQAGELLKRRRDRVAANPPEALPAPAQAALLPAPDLDLLARFEADLQELRSDLDDYITSRVPVTVSDDYLLRTAEALRRVMEAVYGVPVLLPGEASQPAGVSGSINADEVAGYVAAVRTDRAQGNIRGTTTVGTVRKGGTAVGVEVRDSRRRR